MSKIEDRESFTYKYSAKQREEIYQIRKKYESPAEDKLERLRHLDSLTVKKASIHALTLGIIGVLVLGTGMSFTMTNLYEVIRIISEELNTDYNEDAIIESIKNVDYSEALRSYKNDYSSNIELFSILWNDGTKDCIDLRIQPRKY